ncbi:stress responsive alpha/beta barrel protein [Aliiruegeria haliotis]|uniref:Stress responsive alpha/beta barrel protein n=1 Tax=Aliiruegeria haliotis TaxID=1280846 RepID=A0A2T0RVN0_9RHOB|nr:Dabb family protein [Aliiruegeria haliotis]PRY25256.1 stress responsive alpha/beta barrel protein [Aliiruegeria haliotis]
MLRHIVLLTFKPDATPEQLEAWRMAVVDMCERSADVLSFTLGSNVGHGPNHYDSALVADFEDIEAFRRYVGGALHKAYVENHARHVVDRIAAIQHEAWRPDD